MYELVFIDDVINNKNFVQELVLFIFISFNYTKLILLIIVMCNNWNVTSRRSTLRRSADYVWMDKHGQTAHMGGDSAGWRKDGLRGGGLLSLRSQPAERGRERGLTLAPRGPETKLKDNLGAKGSRNKKPSWRQCSEKGFHTNSI